MHDPMTVAFDIKWPWPRKTEVTSKDGEKRIDRYYPSFATIWHRDPEKDGSDDSCGWSRPRLTAKQRECLKSLAWSEAYEPWFQRLREENGQARRGRSAGAQALVMVARVIGVRVKWQEICFWAAELVHCPMDNLRSSLCHQPGYHTNNPKDSRSDREDHAYGLFSCLATYILRERRPWWRHPRWHVWHWRVQIHCLQNLKRWLFSRCAGCGKAFPWGYAPVASGWCSLGPTWFKGEEGVYHHNCTPRSVPTVR